MCYSKRMKRTFLLCLLFLPAAAVRAQFTAEEMLQPCTYTNAAGEIVSFRLAAPQFPVAGRTYPLILFLHGSGECGTDNQKQVKVGLPALVSTLLRRKVAEPVLLVAPQCTMTNGWVRRLAMHETFTSDPRHAPALAQALELVRHLVAERQADPDRLYITGLSYGGFGTWDAIQREPELFAAAIPVCGGGDVHRVSALRRLPIWTFHGSADPNVPVACSRRMVHALKQAGGRRVRYTEYEGACHAVWDRVYGDDEVLTWLLRQSRARKPWWKFW